MRRISSFLRRSSTHAFACLFVAYANKETYADEASMSNQTVQANFCFYSVFKNWSRFNNNG